MPNYVCHVNDQIESAIYIGRGNGRRRLAQSPLANPFPITSKRTREQAIGQYRGHLMSNPNLWAFIADLRDRPLSCWCRHADEAWTPDNTCHGDVLTGLLDRFTDDEIRAGHEIWNAIAIGEVLRVGREGDQG